MRVFEQCAEKEELVNADVTYCLSFSIIMLNTDLHNKNMKKEDRMTIDDYIKFNTTYGDMNKGRPLSDKLLRSIYQSILDDQLLIVDDVQNQLIFLTYSPKMRILLLVENGRILWM